MSERGGKLFGKYNEVALLGLGFALTTVVGTILTSRFQTAAEERERGSRREEADLQKATQIYEETTRAASRFLSEATGSNVATYNLVLDIVKKAGSRTPGRQLSLPDAAKEYEASDGRCKEAAAGWDEAERRLKPLIGVYFAPRVSEDVEGLSKSVTDVFGANARHQREYVAYAEGLRKKEIESGYVKEEDDLLRQEGAAIRAADVALGKFSEDAVAQLRRYAKSSTGVAAQTPADDAASPAP